MADMDLDDLEKYLKRKSKDLREAVAEGLLQAAYVVAGDLAESTVKLLNKDPTGALAGSWKPVFLGVSKKPPYVSTVGVYTDKHYAEIHEEGGFIEPKNANHLAIPLNNNAKLQGPRDFPGELTIIPSSGEKSNVKWILGTITGKRKKRFIPQYALAEYVEIKGTHYISKAAEASAPKVKALIGSSAVDVFTSKRGK